MLTFILLSTLLSTSAQAEDTDWLVRTARMEGAAANIEETAATLEETAARIVASKRLHGIAELVSDADELNRRVLAAGLAAEVLDKAR
ncbi:MAG: hypothetical protein ACI8RZ_003445 [Myxococcota bacterium]|jgi:hypothetical protein